MNEELQQANITISAIEQNQWGYKIKDEKGLVYNITANKQDGTPTVAYQTLTALPDNGMGLQKCFKFVNAANNQGGQSRYVRIISEPEETQPSQASPPQNTTQPSQLEPKPDWDAINNKKDQSMAVLNAKRGACELVASMIHTGYVESKDWKVNFETIANDIFNFRPEEKPPFN